MTTDAVDQLGLLDGYITYDIASYGILLLVVLLVLNVGNGWEWGLLG